MLKKFASLVALVACVLPAPSSAFDPMSLLPSPPAVGASIIGSVVANKVGSDLIAELRAAGANLIGQGEASGNALLIRAGNEMNVLALNLSNAAGREVDKQVRHMSARVQPLMAHAQYVLDNRGRIEKLGYELKDSAVLDLRRVAAAYAPFEAFFVQRIDGAALLHKGMGDYSIAIAGVGLGQDSENLKSTVTFHLAGREVPARKVGYDANTALFRVPVSHINGRFKAKTLTRLPAAFRVTQQRKSFFGWGKPKSYVVPFEIALLPRYAGRLELVLTEPVYGWQRNDRLAIKQVRTTGDHNCPKCPNPPETPYSLSAVVPSSGLATPQPGDRRILEPNSWCHTDVRKIPIPFGRQRFIEQDFSGCPWTRRTGLVVTPDGSRVDAQYLVWGKAVTLELQAAVEEYTLLEQRTRPVAYDLFYDDILEIDAPNATGVSGRGRLQLVNGNSASMVLGLNDSAGTLSLQQKVPGPTHDRYQYLVRRPPQVDDTLQ
jgi:hypothetical protein